MLFTFLNIFKNISFCEDKVSFEKLLESYKVEMSKSQKFRFVKIWVNKIKNLLKKSGKITVLKNELRLQFSLT